MVQTKIRFQDLNTYLYPTWPTQWIKWCWTELQTIEWPFAV